jgi:hypothetical protein
MIASRLADNLSRIAASLAHNVSRNRRGLRAEPPMMASGYK